MTDQTFRPLAAADRHAALMVINTAARWYQEFLPSEAFHDPEMTPDQWDTEARRLTWYGAFMACTLVGVMGLEYVRDAALLRHAYILPAYQRQGIGLQFAAYLERQIRTVGRIIVGTYAENYKARQALEKTGYHLSRDSEATLRAYYTIPEDRLQSSVAYEKTL